MTCEKRKHLIPLLSELRKNVLLDHSPANGMREVEGDNMTTKAASGPRKQGRLLSSISQPQTVDTRKWNA